MIYGTHKLKKTVYLRSIRDMDITCFVCEHCGILIDKVFHNIHSENSYITYEWRFSSDSTLTTGYPPLACDAGIMHEALE